LGLFESLGLTPKTSNPIKTAGFGFFERLFLTLLLAYVSKYYDFDVFGAFCRIRTKVQHCSSGDQLYVLDHTR